jgi:hypothetical protein
MKRKLLIFLLLTLFLIVLLNGTKCYAMDLDRITNYIVTVEPRMNDGSLDITYEITWKVLDSTTEGPLEWVQIGTPNSYFDTPTALTKNIRNITTYNGAYVKIVFDKKYYEGDEITFKYKIHQTRMYKLSGKKCKYSFTPAWFTDARVDSLTVKWNADEVKSSNSKSKDGNYLVWNKANMDKGEKLKINVKYNKNAFGYLSKNMQKSNNSSGIIVIIFLIVIEIIAIIPIFTRGRGYYGHGGFYGGGYHGRGYYGGCAHSSCACASSCASSCACACAGSGRAGCSKKDFYGTKISKEELRKAIKED